MTAIQEKNKPLFSVKTLVILSLLTAMGVVLKCFLGYNGQILRISFAYLPIAMAGMLFGIAPGILVSFLIDLLGALISYGSVNPFLSIVAILEGAVYGYFLYTDKPLRGRVILAQAVVTVALHLFLDTVIISLMFGKGIFAMLPGRLIKNGVTYPIKVASLLLMAKYRTVFEKLI